MTNFEEMGFTPGILKAIQELGFENPMPVQEKVIPLMLGGEVDIIASHYDNYDKLKKLSFIEVKTRSYGEGSAERAVDEEKMKKFFKACQSYCFENNIDIGITPIMFEQISIYVERMPDKFVLRKYVIPVD